MGGGEKSNYRKNHVLLYYSCSMSVCMMWGRRRVTGEGGELGSRKFLSLKKKLKLLEFFRKNLPRSITIYFYVASIIPRKIVANLTFNSVPAKNCCIIRKLSKTRQKSSIFSHIFVFAFYCHLCLHGQLHVKRKFLLKKINIVVCLGALKL